LRLSSRPVPCTAERLSGFALGDGAREPASLSLLIAPQIVASRASPAGHGERSAGNHLAEGIGRASPRADSSNPRSKIGIPIERSSFRMARLSVDCSTSTARAAVEAAVIRRRDGVAKLANIGGHTQLSRALIAP
jgi:hypothetical protein